MIFFVGSTNPVKINAVKVAVEQQWPDARIIGVTVSSGVSPQPFSDQETKKGAENRSKMALANGLLTLSTSDLSNYQQGNEEALGVGLEGGVFKEKNELWSTVWACVYHHSNGRFFANGARFKVPEALAKPIVAGEEMGKVAKRLAGGIEVKHANGVIGMVTNNYVTRTEEYASIAKLAIGLWYGREWAHSLNS